MLNTQFSRKSFFFRLLKRLLARQVQLESNVTHKLITPFGPNYKKQMTFLVYYVSDVFSLYLQQDALIIL